MAQNKIELELDIQIGYQGSWPLSEERMEDICAAVLEYEHIQRPCGVSLSLVDDEEIARLNKEWRGKDFPTDVISIECERPDDPDLAEGEMCTLGDIILAPDYIEQQAKDFASSFDAEATLLIVHGMLHLLGYDHLEDDEAELMEQKEDELMQELLPEQLVSHVLTTRHRED